MQHAVRKFFRQHSRLLILGGAVLIYLAVTLPAFFVTHHTLKNLEPYPDGLYYALGGKALADTNTFELRYRDAVLVPQVPVVYPFVLSVGYRLLPQVETFYLVNVALGVATLWIVWLLLKQLTPHSGVLLLGMSLFVGNAIFLFVPTVPMTENLSLFFFALGLYGLLKKKLSVFDVGVSLIGIAGLFLTHHSALTIAGVLSIWLLYRAKKSVLTTKYKKIFWMVITGGAVAAVVVGWPLITRVAAVLQEMSDQQSSFFHFKYVLGNVKEYLRISLGWPGPFLWLSLPLISPVAALFSGGSVALAFWYKKNRRLQLLFSTVFLSQFPPLVVFYVIDARYSMYTLVLAALMSALCINQLLERVNHKKIVIGVCIGICVLGGVLSQRTLFKQIVAANFLGSSHAWQQEAIQQFDQYFSGLSSGAEPPLLITALPPVLVSAYQTAEYRVLPLSTAQEFLQKKEYMWGSDVPYGDLLGGYEQWLKEGKKLYITNAYITHQASVIQDFEVFKRTFTLTPVSEGCMNACTVYQIGVK